MCLMKGERYYHHDKYSSIASNEDGPLHLQDGERPMSDSYAVDFYKLADKIATETPNCLAINMHLAVYVCVARGAPSVYVGVSAAAVTNRSAAEETLDGTLL